MDTSELDLTTLLEDYEVVMALEAVGVASDHPVMSTIRSRWCIDDELIVARESTLRDVGGAAKTIGKDALGSVAAGIGKVSGAMLHRFSQWGAEKEKSFKKKFDQATSKATKLMESIADLESRVARVNTMPDGDISSGGWTAKVCVEDKLSFKDCVKFSEDHRKIDTVSQSFTTYAATLANDIKTRKESSTEMRKVGKSTGWAIKRGSHLLGIPVHKYSVEAWALPGNVVVVMSSLPGMMERVGFGVARDGKYDDTITRLTKEECETALKAAYKISETLRDRHVKRGVFSYSGVYDELAELKDAKLAARESTAGDVVATAKQLTKDGVKVAAKGALKGAKAAKQLLLPDIAAIRYNNALAVEDALTTAQVRVAEGLIEYVKLSLK